MTSFRVVTGAKLTSTHHTKRQDDSPGARAPCIEVQGTHKALACVDHFIHTKQKQQHAHQQAAGRRHWRAM